MVPSDVVVVRTGVANLASVVAGLRRAGLDTLESDDAALVEDAERVVLPGVGSFAKAVQELDRRGLREPLSRRIRAGRPTLAICLGLQLLGASSEEGSDAVGLQVFDARAGRFDAAVSVPQMGWNSVEPDKGCAFLTRGYAYFANSYRLTDCPEGWHAAWADHGGRFVAALEREGVLACQFHPELSGSWGAALLRRWVTCAGRRVTTC